MIVSWRLIELDYYTFSTYLRAQKLKPFSSNLMLQRVFWFSNDVNLRICSHLHYMIAWLIIRSRPLWALAKFCQLLIPKKTFCHREKWMLIGAARGIVIPWISWDNFLLNPFHLTKSNGRSLNGTGLHFWNKNCFYIQRYFSRFYCRINWSLITSILGNEEAAEAV